MIINLVSDIQIAKNFALQKVRIFHANNEIIENDLDAIGKPGVYTYISNIFRRNREKYEPYNGMKNVLIGGSGWDLSITLPPEIDAIKPHVNFGFTSRGCNRTCYFCVVPEKEGRFEVTGDLLDIWDGITTGAEITLWDNNILFDHDHFDFICQQARDLGLSLDFNQGIDFRLFTEHTIESLRGVKHHSKWRFALDDVLSIPKFKEVLPLIRQVGATPFVYVYADGQNYDGEIARLDFLRDEKCKPYLQLDDCVRHIEKYQVMRDYCNGINGHFQRLRFDEYYPVRQMREKRTMTDGSYMRQVKIKDIIVPNNRRALREDLSALMRSIESRGRLIHPITITENKVLIAGAHRLESCKQLGWAEITAIIVTASEIERKMIELEENLCNYRYTALEEQEALEVCREFYESKYPGSSPRAKSIRNLPKNKTQPIDNLQKPQNELISFTEEMSKKTGKHQRTIQIKLQSIANIPISVRNKIRPSTIADRQKDLNLLSKKKEAEQHILVDLVLSGQCNNISEANYRRSKEIVSSRPEPTEPIMGTHFLHSSGFYCADYLELLKVYRKNTVNCVMTDAPYSVLDEGWDRDFDPIPLLKETSRILSETGSALIFCNDKLLPVYLQEKNHFGMKLRQIIHWNKTNPDLSAGKGGRRYVQAIEYILWFSKTEEFTFNLLEVDKIICGEANTDVQTTGLCLGDERIRVIGADGVEKTLHRCQKPLKLMENLVKVHTNRGDIVIDPFTGTGTTAVACIKHGRSFMGTEQDPDYFKQAGERIKMVKRSDVGRDLTEEEMSKFWTPEVEADYEYYRALFPMREEEDWDKD